MLGGADNPNGELPSYITGANIVELQKMFSLTQRDNAMLNERVMQLSQQVQHLSEQTERLSQLYSENWR